MSFFSEPVAHVVKRIQNGDVRCADVVDKSLAAIRDKDGDIHSFISVQADRARDRARFLDSLDCGAKADLPLCGVPVAVKDNICTLDVPTTCASKILLGFVPPYSATVVEALEKAGAVIIGKTNLDEFAMGSTTENSFFGMTRNPHDLSHIPGGSSGGSAAAVAAGFVPLALGSDTGGSIRLPCCYCGAVGLKPTYGRVSRFGLVAFGSSLDQIGPMASDVRDIGLLLSIISAPDGRDSTCAGERFANDPSLYGGAVDKLTIGMPREYFGEGLSAPVRASIGELMEKLSNAGASFVDVSLTNLDHGIATYYIICTAEASSNLARYDGVKYGFRSDTTQSLLEMYQSTRQEGFGAEVKRRIMLGTYVLSSGYYDAYYLKAARVRTLIANDFDRVFATCDAVISPVAATTAFAIGAKCDDPLSMYLTDIYTVSANLAGIPGISVPCGKDGHLPIGVQFMAPKWREDTLLRLGYATQTLIDG